MLNNAPTQGQEVADTTAALTQAGIILVMIGLGATAVLFGAAIQIGLVR